MTYSPNSCRRNFFGRIFSLKYLRTRPLFSLFFLLAAGTIAGSLGGFWFSAPRSVVAADGVAGNSDTASTSQPQGIYSELPLDTGVFNAGQAALWDLDIFDHFHYFGPVQRAKGHRPEQPIKFSHVTHVQKNKMECQYCHWSVAKAAYAAIPEVETCIGCHGMMIPGTTDAQKAEIKKIKEFWDKGEAIPWVKVHVMPNHVFFNHKRHVKAGVACQECHGQVPNMQVVERVSSMKMGWCVDCHRQRGTSIDCWTCHK